MNAPKDPRSVEGRGHEANKVNLLLDINNQCSEVQHVIAKKLHDPEDKEFLDVLGDLLVLLRRFLNGEN